ncbi:DUF6794 domain-containing protein [Methylomonas koyamae]|uniref:DUF6794 domain-containing protein n=1 Tax=Methylomonas koyamae TaxID=702114 RepID=UPI0006CF4BBD|nr:DUF6794 domain-containing protein [Methylomonas koyamae]
MSKNWSFISQDILQPPNTVDDAVNRLMLILSYEERHSIAGMNQIDLIDLHFSLGAAIRNAYDLHNPTNPLLAECGTTFADDASDVIIQALWQQLQ